MTDSTDTTAGTSDDDGLPDESNSVKNGHELHKRIKGVRKDRRKDFSCCSVLPCCRNVIRKSEKGKCINSHVYKDQVHCQIEY
jgi:hypothetical protein